MSCKSADATPTESPEPSAQGPASNTHTYTGSFEPAGRFDYQRLHAYEVAKAALVSGERIALGLPRGYGKLCDQLRRALLSAFLGIAEAASRTGADRKARFRCARGEAAEAAAALEAVQVLGLARQQDTAQTIALLSRLCAMLTRLSGYGK